MLVLDSINFGSGWFPTLRKRPGMSGYFTVASSLTDFWRASGGWSARRTAGIEGGGRRDRARPGPGPRADGALRRGAARPRPLPRWAPCRSTWWPRPAARPSGSPRCSRPACPSSTTSASGSAPRSPPNDLALAGVAEFHDLDRLTIFADNLVPHVLRVDGVLVYDPALAARIDAGELLEPGAEEREIRGCAVHACELLAERLGMPARLLDMALWNRGQAPTTRRCRGTAPGRSSTSRPRCPGRRGASGGGPPCSACGRSARPPAPRARSGGWRGR